MPLQLLPLLPPPRHPARPLTSPRPTTTTAGELNSLNICFKCPDEGNTVRIVNLAPVEFPCYVHLKEN